MFCNQCEMLSINRIACHELGCPNMNARWDTKNEEWVTQTECRQCGFMVDCDHRGQYECDCSVSEEEQR